MKAFLLSLAVMVVLAVGANAVLDNAGFTAAEKAAQPASVRLGD